MSRPRALLFTAIALLIAATAHAVPVPGLFDTGVDAAGALLSAGATDPHYAMIVSADPAYPGPDAVVASPIASPYWLPNSASSKWIAPAMAQGYPSGGTPHPGGAYTYRLTFDLTGIDPSTVLITGGCAGDNNGSIRLNGASTGTSVSGYNPLTAFSIATGFVAGINHLDFVVTNFAAGGVNPTGLRVQGISGTGNATAGVEDGIAPQTLELLAPFPNPSRGLARMGFALPRAARVTLTVRDLAGRTVRTLVRGDFAAGRHDATWDGRTDANSVVPAGVYIVDLTASDQHSSRRVVWMK